MANELQSNRNFGRRRCDVKPSLQERMLIGLGWFIAVGLVVMHGTWAFLKFMPLDYIINYNSVVPTKQEFKVNKQLRFIAHTDLKKKAYITFEDTLFCRDENGGAFEKYASQNNTRIHNDLGDDKYTSFVFSPGVPYPTECYLETLMTVHLPLHVERHLQYSGFDNDHIFKIVADPDKLTDQCLEHLFDEVSPAAGKSN